MTSVESLKSVPVPVNIEWKLDWVLESSCYREVIRSIDIKPNAGYMPKEWFHQDWDIIIKPKRIVVNP